MFKKKEQKNQLDKLIEKNLLKIEYLDEGSDDYLNACRGVSELLKARNEVAKNNVEKAKAGNDMKKTLLDFGKAALGFAVSATVVAQAYEFDKQGKFISCRNAVDFAKSFFNKNTK